ncbi:MAG: nucleotidyltransferase domain-containing protein [Treponema sp.]|nr:nucleotidyltransferase domain-containing protein [Treponema sp.]
MTLKELRLSKGLTQDAAASLIGVTRKTYLMYEKNEESLPEMKRKAVFQLLEEYGFVDETHGVLTLEQIKEACASVFKDYDVEYAVLFGSYSKGKAHETSDVDLLVSANVRGIKFFGMVEGLREALKKKVDVLDLNQLNNNLELVKEILKDGIKIYG